MKVLTLLLAFAVVAKCQSRNEFMKTKRQLFETIDLNKDIEDTKLFINGINFRKHNKDKKTANKMIIDPPNELKSIISASSISEKIISNNTRTPFKNGIVNSGFVNNILPDRKKKVSVTIISDEPSVSMNKNNSLRNEFKPRGSLVYTPPPTYLQQTALRTKTKKPSKLLRATTPPQKLSSLAQTNQRSTTQQRLNNFSIQQTTLPQEKYLTPTTAPKQSKYFSYNQRTTNQELEKYLPPKTTPQQLKYVSPTTQRITTPALITFLSPKITELQLKYLPATPQRITTVPPPTYLPPTTQRTTTLPPTTRQAFKYLPPIIQRTITPAPTTQRLTNSPPTTYLPPTTTPQQLKYSPTITQRTTAAPPVTYLPPITQRTTNSPPATYLPPTTPQKVKYLPPIIQQTTTVPSATYLPPTTQRTTSPPTTYLPPTTTPQQLKYLPPLKQPTIYLPPVAPSYLPPLSSTPGPKYLIPELTSPRYKQVTLPPLRKMPAIIRYMYDTPKFNFKYYYDLPTPAPLPKIKVPKLAKKGYIYKEPALAFYNEEKNYFG